MPTLDKMIKKPLEAAKWKPLIVKTETKYGMPPGMLFTLIAKESGFDPNATNKWSGAAGLMQLMPKIHTTVDPYNPKQAIPYGGFYLYSLKNRFGSWVMALAAYNWGPGNVNKWLAGSKFPPKETRDYMVFISQNTPNMLS